MTSSNRPVAIAIACAFVLAASAALAEDGYRIHTSADPMLKLRTIAFEGGRTVEMTVGIGSGAFRHPSLPGNIFQTVSDRGPNFECDEGAPITALTEAEMCAATKGARIYPVPEYAPSIYTVEILPNASFRILDVIALKDKDGRPLTGLTNPLTKAKTEIPFDARGRRLAQDPGAVDAEALVRLDDGTYWIADESAPSLLHVAADGRVIKRLVPKGTEGDFSGANYAVEGKLPEVLYKRQTNRGVESLAISPDGKFLYFVMQSPLANPDSDTYKASANARLFKFDREGEKMVGEYLYVLDAPESFRLDASKKQNAVKLSEMMATGMDKMIVLERISKTTKLYEVDLAGATNILGSRWDGVATASADPAAPAPLSLEATPADKSGITPLAKALVFDTADHEGLPEKIEALARLGDGSVAMVNDDDFGIEGGRTQVIVAKELKASKPQKQAAAGN